MLAVKIGPDGISRRGAPTYQAEATVLVTQSGFPWGRSTFDQVIPVRGSTPIPRFSDPSRFQYLATLYATLAYGDEVHQLVRRKFGLPPVAPKDEVPGKDPSSRRAPAHAADSTPLPTVTIAGLGPTPKRAMTVANVAMESLRSVIRQQQNRAGIAADSRVELQVVGTPRFATVVKPNRPTTAVMMFLLGLMLTVVGAFIAESRAKRAGQAAAPRTISEPERSEAPAVSPVAAVATDANVERLDRPRSLTTLGEAPRRDDGRDDELRHRGRMRAPGPGV